MTVLVCQRMCYLKNKMTRKVLRTLTLVMFMCCTYGVYKLPGLYWSFKSSQHQSVIGKTSHNSYRGLEDKLDNTNTNIFISGDSDPKTSYDSGANLNNIYESDVRENVSFSNKETVSELKNGVENEDNSVSELGVAVGKTKSENESILENANIDSPKELNGSIDPSDINDLKKDNRNTSDEYENVLREIEESVDNEIRYNTADEDIKNGEFVFENEDVEFNLNDINEFQETSENLFKTFPNHQNATKYLIYLCEGKCGGLGDRLKGITMVYMMSILTERRFAISMETPCELEHFLKPNILDWRFPAKKEIAGKTLQTLDCFERHDAYEIDFQKFDPDPISLLKADVVLIKANQDWTRIFRKMSVSPKRFPQLYQHHSSELLRTIYIGLFQPSNELKTLVDDFFKKSVNGKKLACLHARMGEKVYQRYTYREILIPLHFLKSFDKMDDYKIMVATDTDNVKTISEHMFRKFVDTSGPILHIDYMRNGSMTQDLKCAGFMRSMVDHLVLQRCDKLVLTGSGFGVTAASIRHTSRGLYVYMRGEAVMPTRRELVRETFQWRCLAPSWDSKFYSNICDS